MISSILSRLVILIFGTLYPVYASYKAVRSKDVKGYVQWMMYWIVFGLFTCTETITDIFLSWFPFYYEIKIIVVFWLLSPATKGSSILYRKFVHPTLSNREQEIDECISKAKQQTYRQVLDLGSKGVSVLMQTALKGGGGLVNQLKKSYSLSDLSDTGLHDEIHDEADEVSITDPRLILRKKRGRSPHTSSSTNSAVYFSEIDVRAASVKSIEDISSGYSSGEGLHAGLPLKVQAREALHRTGSLTRSRTTRTTRSSAVPVTKKTTATGANSDESDENEIFDTNIIFLNDRAKNINKLSLAKTRTSSAPSSSDSETEFFESCTENSNSILMHDGLCIKDGTKTKTQVDTVYFNNKVTLNACKLDEIHMDLDVVTKSKTQFPSFTINNSQKAVATTRDLVERPSEPTKDAISTLIPSLVLNKSQNFPQNKSVVNTSSRGGRYNKKMAPLPPAAHNPIKATLILQPGVVRNLPNNPTGESDQSKEIFLHHSPKLSRRKSLRSKSPSPSSSSSSKNKLDVLSKILHKIPKKISDKRHSWQDFFNSNPVKENKNNNLSLGISGNRLSRSENTLFMKSDEATSSTDACGKMPGVSLKRTNSQISIRKLKESPLANRRLKIIRTYVDQDID